MGKKCNEVCANNHTSYKNIYETEFFDTGYNNSRRSSFVGSNTINIKNTFSLIQEPHSIAINGRLACDITYIGPHLLMISLNHLAHRKYIGFADLRVDYLLQNLHSVAGTTKFQE